MEITDENNPFLAFTSDSATHRQCFNVTIIADGVLEATETFSLNLTLVEGSTVPVVVDPDTSVVEITDVNCKDFRSNNNKAYIFIILLLIQLSLLDLRETSPLLMKELAHLITSVCESSLILTYFQHTLTSVSLLPLLRCLAQRVQ